MVSRDHEVCLAAEHTEHRGLPRSHKLVDTNAEGAVLFALTDLVLATAAL